MGAQRCQATAEQPGKCSKPMTHGALRGSSEQGRRQWMPVRRGKPGQLPTDREQWFCSTFGREAIPEDRPDRFAAPMAQPPHPRRCVR